MYDADMQFELTDALIDHILFSMEDQNGEFLVDTVEGVVAGGVEGLDDLENDGSRYISLPEWDSSNGFELMKHFAARFKNPLIQKELTAALDRGRGVFRAFKDTLSRYPEAEKLWFAYKEQEMKREILRWYNSLREEWGLEKIGMEPEETVDLLLEDFCFRPFKKSDRPHAEELHRRCLEEHKEMLAESGADASAGAIVREAQRVLLETPGERGFVANSGNGEFAAYITGTVKDASLYVQNLEVKAEFRGLGIGEVLLTRFLDSMNPDEVRQVFLDLPSWAEDFSRVLLRESFKPYTVRYWLKLRDRTG